MLPPPKNFFARILIWRARHIPQEQFILILSVLVGFITGLVAVTLKNSTHFIQNLIGSDAFSSYYSPYYFIFPIIGILITVGIRYLIKERIGEGIPSALFAISRKGGFLAPYRMFASVVTSIFTVGFGGSVGLEGPAVSTGSAIGSNLGRLMHINYRSKILLMSCASASAIAAIFNAPITAIVFTIEIFSLDLTMSSLIPLLLSSIAGAVTSIFLQGNDYLFHYRLETAFQLSDLPYYALLGILAAFVSLYFNKISFSLDDFFSRMKKQYSRILIGGTLLSLVIFLIPELYGEGYETINRMLNGTFSSSVGHFSLEQYIDHEYFILVFMLGMIFLKAFATSFTMGAGGVGGVFAPSIFMGASTGYFFARFINDLKITTLTESNFVLVGMTGLMAGILHAPLTAVFLIAEITGGYELFIPLMLVSAISYLITKKFMPYSFYTRELVKKGDLLTHNKDQAVLTLLNVSKVLETNFRKISPKMTLRELVKVVTTSKRNLFPVVNDEGKLVGIITLDDIRSFMFDVSVYDVLVVAELMYLPPATIDADEDMSEVIRKFQSTGAWNLPVLKDGMYLGFVSKSKLFSAYRRKLIEFTG